MSRGSLAVPATVMVIAVIAAPAAAQTGWVGHARLSVDLGAQTNAERLSEGTTFERYFEPVSLTAELPKAPIPFVGGGVAIRVAGSLGVGLGVSYLSSEDEATIAARVPHPFYFGQARDVDGTASIYHAELATHLGIVYVVGSPRVTVALSGGPSFVKLDQDLVTDLDFTEAYPYDVVSFADVKVERVSESKVGYHVAADIAWSLTRRWGVGGLLRVTRARVSLKRPGDVAVGEMNLGGLQVGGGLRIFF